MIRAVIFVLVLMLAGCATSMQQPIRVPVPVECRVQTPVRPTMPTERLVPGVNLDQFVAATQAEIEVRQGYELELRAALAACTAPV